MMTAHGIALLPLVERRAGGDLLRLGHLVLQRLMDAEAEAPCGHDGPGRSQNRSPPRRSLYSYGSVQCGKERR